MSLSTVITIREFHDATLRSNLNDALAGYFNAPRYKEWYFEACIQQVVRAIVQNARVLENYHAMRSK